MWKICVKFHHFDISLLFISAFSSFQKKNMAQQIIFDICWNIRKIKIPSKLLWWNSWEYLWEPWLSRRMQLISVCHVSVRNVFDFLCFFSVSGDMLLETWLMRCSKFKSSNQSHAGCSVPMPWLQICLLPGCYLKCVVPIACETASNIGLTNEKCGDFGVRCQWNGDISYQISSIQELNHQTQYLTGLL